MRRGSAMALACVGEKQHENYGRDIGSGVPLRDVISLEEINAGFDRLSTGKPYAES